MRYLITLLAVMLYYCPSYAGEVWVVKPRPAKSVWVVQKPSNDLKVSAKTCPCSNQCACGCNSGKECTCNQTPPVTQTGRQFVPAQYQSSVCIGGT